jgi:hypothetical protein
MMDRRSFLRMLGLAAPVAAVAPTYFFAPVGGWKSDVIINLFDTDFPVETVEFQVNAIELEAWVETIPGLESHFMARKRHRVIQPFDQRYMALKRA